MINDWRAKLTGLEGFPYIIFQQNDGKMWVTKAAFDTISAACRHMKFCLKVQFMTLYGPDGVKLEHVRLTTRNLRKLTDDDVRYIRSMRKTGSLRSTVPQAELAEKFNVSQGQIAAVQNYRIYRYVEEDKE